MSNPSLQLFGTGFSLMMQSKSNVEALLKNFQREKNVIFPVLINSNHWIGVSLSPQNLLGYYEPLGSKISRNFSFVKLLEKAFGKMDLVPEVSQNQWDKDNCGPLVLKWFIEKIQKVRFQTEPQVIRKSFLAHLLQQSRNQK